MYDTDHNRNTFININIFTEKMRKLKQLLQYNYLIEN